MKIAILGGTGKEGAGLATRWALAGHSIIIGSRDAERARTKAADLREITRKLPIVGHTNIEAAELGDSTVVPLTFGGPRLFTPPAAGSSAEEAQALLPDAKVIAAFHHIAAHELAELDRPIACDVLMCGGDAAAKQVVQELAASMNVRAVDVGPLSNAGPLEGITAVLATINRRYKLKDAGIKITGL